MTYRVTYDQGQVHITCPSANAQRLDTAAHVLFEQGITLDNGIPVFYGSNVEISTSLNPHDPRSLETIQRVIDNIITMMLGPTC